MLGEGDQVNADLSLKSWPLTTAMCKSLGGELWHATKWEHICPIFEEDLQPRGRSGTMACPQPHWDKRAKDQQKTKDKKWQALIAYDAVAANEEAWKHGRGGYINDTGTTTICHPVNMRKFCTRLVLWDDRSGRPIAQPYNQKYKNVPVVGIIPIKDLTSGGSYSAASDLERLMKRLTTHCKGVKVDEGGRKWKCPRRKVWMYGGWLCLHLMPSNCNSL